MKVIISLIVVVIVAIGGGTWYAVSQSNKPLTNAKFEAMPIADQFENAPEGHYIHLHKHDTVLYKTTWTPKQIKKYISYTYTTSTNGKVHDDGTTNAKSKLGTSHLFKDNMVVDSKYNDGEIATIFADLSGNSRYNDNMTYYEEDAYYWYFNSINDAKNDPDVSASVTKIVR